MVFPLGGLAIARLVLWAIDGRIKEGSIIREGKNGYKLRCN